MIYHIYWSSIRDSIKKISPYSTMYGGMDWNSAATLAETIKRSEDDSFVFIVTEKNKEANRLRSWIKAYALEDYVVYESPIAITNPIHKDNGPNLRVFVMVSKQHFWRELTEDIIEEELVSED